MQGKANWQGKEIEGRYHGLSTYFIRHEIGIVPDYVHHLYFTIEFFDNKDAVEQIESWLGEQFIISIETSKDKYHLLTPNMKVWAHIIYRIDDELPHDLKETDSIFIDKGKYNVLCFIKHQAYKVNPIDYSNDKV